MDRATSSRPRFHPAIKVGWRRPSPLAGAVEPRFGVCSHEERDPDQKLKLMLFMTPALIVGGRCGSWAGLLRLCGFVAEGAF